MKKEKKKRVSSHEFIPIYYVIWFTICGLHNICQILFDAGLSNNHYCVTLFPLFCGSNGSIVTNGNPFTVCCQVSWIHTIDIWIGLVSVTIDLKRNVNFSHEHNLYIN